MKIWALKGKGRGCAGKEEKTDGQRGRGGSGAVCLHFLSFLSPGQTLSHVHCVLGHVVFFFLEGVLGVCPRYYCFMTSYPTIEQLETTVLFCFPIPMGQECRKGGSVGWFYLRVPRWVLPYFRTNYLLFRPLH